MKPTARDRRLLILYGITEAEYNKILEYQGGGCFVCGRTAGTLSLSVDHDHKTGTPRGILCWDCNKAAQCLRDDQTRARRLAMYLEVTPVAAALDFTPVGRPGRSTRKWRTKREKRERLEFVKLRIKEIGNGES